MALNRPTERALFLEAFEKTRWRHGRARNMHVPPANHLFEDRKQVCSPGCKTVLMPKRLPLVRALFQQARAFEALEPVGQNVGGNPLLGLHQFSV